MQSWQDKCADIIDFLESHFKEVKYKIYFGRKNDEWTFWVEKVRSDGGTHDGSAVIWLFVAGKDIDELPDKMLAKAEDAVLTWQKEGFEQVKKQLENWQKTRAELDKRLHVNEEFEKLNQKVGKGRKIIEAG